MSQTSIDVHGWSAPAAAATAAVNPAALRGLQRKMLEAVAACRDEQEAFQAAAGVAAESLEPLAIYYFQGGQQEGLDCCCSFVSRQSIAAPQVPSGLLRDCCEAACREACVQVRRLGAGGGLAAVAAPVFHTPAGAAAVVALFPPTLRRPDHACLILQLLSAHLALWHAGRGQQQAQRAARTPSALLQLVAELLARRDLPQACETFVHQMQRQLGCHRVVVGLRRGPQGACRLRAVSGMSQFDKRSQLAGALESALDEALLRNEVTVWPPLADTDRQGARAHQRLCVAAASPAVISAPLRDEQNEVCGAWLLLGDQELVQRGELAELLRAAAKPLGCCLHTLARAERGPAVRLVQRLLGRQRPWKMKAALVAALLLAALLGMSVPYKIACDCEIEPVTRRFVAAPYAGTLEKSLVAPGELVTSGQLLARMDGREIRWELAALDADYIQATKKRDAAQANQQVAAAQLARLEMDRLQLKRKLLEHRAEHLEIRSPLDGIVASGDLERAEGAPLSIGQTLFEIAPLSQMIAEVAVPEEEIAYVRTGLQVRIRLDAYPSRTWIATLVRIQPRAELREHQSVFIAEAVLDNSQGALRPGMQGRAKIVELPRRLGWILFHKPWEALTAALGW